MIARFLLLSLLTVSPAFADEAPNPHKDHVRVRVVTCSRKPHTIRVAAGPADVCVEVKVIPHADHRALRLTWDFEEPSPVDVMNTMIAMPGDPADTLMDTMNGGEAGDMQGALGSAEDDLDGDQERVTIRPDHYKLMGLAGGTYEIRVAVYADAGKRRLLCGRVTTLRVSNGREN